jgi:tRNA pseudouridine13 synthase
MSAGTDPVRSLPHAWGTPVAQGCIRQSPEDFRVDEIPAITPAGRGEHLLLRVEKRLANTEWVARRLAEVAGVEPLAVGYAGLKDRRAVTTQWFSVHRPAAGEPDWSVLEPEGVRVLDATRHTAKLRRGELEGNRFRIRVTALAEAGTALESRLRQVAEAGVPNYFGEQRFGHDGENLARVEALFAGRGPVRDRHRRGLYLSAARACLFNAVLAQRVAAGSWNRALPGDVVLLPGGHGELTLERVDAAVAARVAEGRLTLTGPLWGRGGLTTAAEARAVELQALAPWAALRAGLEAAGLYQERRALGLRPRGFTWDQPRPDVLELAFDLPAGSYATVVLRELVDLQSESAGGSPAGNPPKAP